MQTPPAPPSVLLPLDDHHTVELKGLSPDDIKLSARTIIENPAREIRHVGILDFVSKALGFSGGFPTYKRTHYSALLNFMKQHGLRTPRDLFEPPPFPNDFFIHVTRLDAADRVFLGQRPERIFTGYDFDHPELQQGHFDNDFVAQLTFRNSGHSWEQAATPLIPATARGFEDHPDLLPDLAYGFRQLLDGFMNLIGDSLVQPSSGAFNQTYSTQSGSCDSFQGDPYKFAFGLFRKFIETSNAGWVDVIPYPDNKNLVFLRGRNGEYDYLVRNIRTTPPPRPVPAIIQREWPSAIVQKFEFPRFYYFWKNASEEKQRHESEMHFYRNGGQGGRFLGYPGENAILRDFLEATGQYSGRAARIPNRLEGFTEVKLKTGRIFCSELITIREFRRFLAESGYSHEPRLEQNLYFDDYDENLDFENANSDPEHLPVACSWLAAIAYCKWRESRENVPFRLLTMREYFPARGIGFLPSERKHVSACCLDMSTATEVPSSIRFDPETKERIVEETHPVFKGVAQFAPNIPEIIASSGLKFIEARGFLEWTMFEEPSMLLDRMAQAVGANGLSIDYNKICKDAWGARFGCKIGFRICYDA